MFKSWRVDSSRATVLALEPDLPRTTSARKLRTGSNQTDTAQAAVRKGRRKIEHTIGAARVTSPRARSEKIDYRLAQSLHGRQDFAFGHGSKA